VAASERIAPRPLVSAVAGEPVRQHFGTLRAGGPDAFHGRPPIATVKWGDRSRKERLKTAFDAAAGGFVAAGVHAYADPGTYKVAVVFRRGERVLGRIRGAVEVARISPGGRDLSAVAGQPFAGAVGTLERGQLPLTNPAIDWGDGTAPSAAALTEAAGGTYEVSGTHAYAAPGTYRVRAFVTDSPPRDPAVIFSTITVTAE
jgi:hypothetical protein